MGLLDRIFNRQPQPETKPEGRSYSSALAGSVGAILGGSNKVTPATALESSVVRACVQKIAQTVASLDVDLFKVDGLKQNRITHPLTNLLKKSPFRDFTAFELWEKILSDSLIFGEGFALIHRDKNARVIGLEYLPAEDMEVTTLGTDELKAYVLKEADEIYLPDELVIIKNFRSESAAVLHSETLSLAKSAENFGLSFFENGGNVSGIISTDHSLTEEQFNRLNFAWHSRNHGKGAQHSTAILEHGMKYDRIGTNPEASQLTQVRKYQAEEVTRIFGVPPALIGLDTNVTFSNVEQQGIFFATYTIQPLLRAIEQELCLKLLSEKETQNIEIRFNISSLLRADAKTRGEYFSALIRDGVVSINEAREKLENLNPVEGGDEHFIQVNLTPLSNPVQAVEGSTNNENNEQ
jgi:HK97 family phage portal protein